MRSISRIFAAVVLAFFAGCQSAVTPGTARSESAQSAVEHYGSGDAIRTIYVVSNGWHTGIVLARSNLPLGLIPEVNDFPTARFFEFSWGDAKYFPAPEKGLGMAMSALFTPTPAVLHLTGLPTHPRQVFPSAETVELQVTSEGFHNLVVFLDDTFARDDSQASLKGLYPFSRFYPATGRFHMFNTCNTWTARGLAGAGIPVSVTGTLQAEELMAQLR